MHTGSVSKLTDEYIADIRIDSKGNVVVLGTYQTTLSLGSITLRNVKTQTSGFVAKFSPQFQVQWAMTLPFKRLRKQKLFIDSKDQVYVFGTFNDRGPVVFGSSTIRNVPYKTRQSPASKYNPSCFMVKMDSTGKYIWAQTNQGQGQCELSGLSVDKNGFIFVGGTYQTSADALSVVFGSTSLSLSGSFVARLDSKGTWLWAKHTDASGIHDLATDSTGNAYVFGTFRGSLTLGTTKLTSKGGDDLYIAKVDTTGKWGWAASAGSTSYDYASRIALDTSGNVYISGTVYDKATFGGFTITALGNRLDAFVAKLDKNGKWLWVASGGGHAHEQTNGLAVDSAGNAYLSGKVFMDTTQLTAVFGSIKLQGVTNMTTYAFTAKVGNTGKWQWIRTGYSAVNSNNLYGLGLDASGNVYTGGSFTEGVLFGSTRPKIKDTFSGKDIVLLKYSASGQLTNHAVFDGDTGNSDTLGDITQDNKGNIYMTGTFVGSLRMGTKTITATEEKGDLFVAKFDKHGSLIWLRSATLAHGYTVAVDVNENVFVGGGAYTASKFGSH